MCVSPDVRHQPRAIGGNDDLSTYVEPLETSSGISDAPGEATPWFRGIVLSAVVRSDGDPGDPPRDRVKSRTGVSEAHESGLKAPTENPGNLDITPTILKQHSVFSLEDEGGDKLEGFCLVHNFQEVREDIPRFRAAPSGSCVFANQCWRE